MCGIHAVFNVDTMFNNSATKYMEQAFVVNAVRGVDSSGLLVVDDKGRDETHKMALQGPLFVESKRVKSMLTDIGRCMLAVGHVRAATAGKVNVDNAHPFVGYDTDGNKVIGVHNGTLTDWRSNKGAALYEVDSEWAIQHIAEENADAFEDFHGAYAFIWWREADPAKVFVARNDQRPMHFVITPDDKTMYLGSEFGMVSWLTERNNIKARDNSVYTIESGMLYEFDLSSRKISWKKSKLPAPVVKRTAAVHTYPKATSFGDRAQQIMKEVNDLIDEGAATMDAPKVMLPALLEGPDPASAPPQLTRAERKKKNREIREKRKEMLVAIANGADEYTLPEGWYSKSLAMSHEQERARSMGVFGQLTGFRPTHFEPDVGDLYGVIDEYISGQGKMEHEAIIRNVTAKQAHDYTTGKKAGWGAIIGLTMHGQNGSPQYVIVGELTEEGREGMAA